MATLIAALLTLLALGLAGLARALERAARALDRRRMLADGLSVEATVVSIAPPDAAGDRRVVLEYPVEGRRCRATQRTPAEVVAALGLGPGARLVVHHRRDHPGAAFAPELLLAAHAPRPRLAPATGEGPVLYVVSFEDPDAPPPLWPAEARGWSAGELVVDGERLRLDAHAPRLLGPARHASRTFARAAIRNVDAHEALVAFEILVAGEPNRIRLWVADAATAKDLALRLPAARTPDFERAESDAAGFQQRLSSVAPTTPVTRALLGACLVAYAAGAAFGAGWLEPDGDRLIALGADYAPLVLGGQWWRLLTAPFLHAGPLHLAFDLVALGVAGPFAERLYGATRFLALYVLAALAAGGLALVAGPAGGSVGATGAIFGVFGATLAYLVREPEGVPARLVARERNLILLLVALSLVLELALPALDPAANLGGLVAGFGLGLGLARPLEARRPPPARERQHALGIGVALGALVLVGVLGGPTTEAVSATIDGGVPGVVPHPTVTRLADIRLGMTRAELDASRGAPLRDGRNTRIYDLGVPGHPALLEVTFRATGPAAAPGDAVGALFYRGEKAYAPPELLYVTGQPRATLRADFGPPAWRLHGRGGITYEMYADGLTLELAGGRVRAYGLQDYYRDLRD